jgi:hypothetical protein
MMAAAWPRESVLFDDKFANAARPLQQTGSARWRRILLRRLLVLAVDKLTAIDFTPRALRAAPKQAGEKLVLAARIIEQAADLKRPEAQSFPETTNAGQIIVRNSLRGCGLPLQCKILDLLEIEDRWLAFADDCRPLAVLG